MQVIESIRAMQALADAERAAGRRLALVPTMGALHAGHLSLVAIGRSQAEVVIVSIFVNPTQFNDPTDLERYPRPLEADLSACRAAGVDVVFAPTSAEMYPVGSETCVETTEVSKPLCGRTRPGHFKGVTTIVSKLFLATKPHVAIFGQKDFQQLAVIRRFARDLNFDVEIVGGDTVREPDGVAMSSRNANLDAEARSQACVLARALDAVEAAVGSGERDVARLRGLAEREIAKAPLAEIDYVELCDLESLEAVPAILSGPALLALAVFLRTAVGGSVRLIDNRVLRPQHQPEEAPR